MKIVVFSLGIVFPDKVEGGSQKVLIDVARGLGKRGHTITIYCPASRESGCEFEAGTGVTVKPILPLRGAFPMPYSVSPFSLAETARILQSATENADLLYCHDGGLLIESLKMRIPTVISLRDFCYEETLLGALNFRQNAIIVNSEHTFRCLYDSFARVNSNIMNKVHLVHNGYDAQQFSRRPVTQEFLQKTGLPPRNGDVIVGFPHRPQKEKGFLNALYVIKKLKEKYPSIRLLVPLYMDQGLSQRTDSTYQAIYDTIQAEHLENNILFHPWIGHTDMPEYFSYCDVVLCIGNFVEAFSNVSAEALLCQTPVVAANVATYRSFCLRKYLNIVEYGNIDDTAQCVASVLEGNDGCDLSEARAYISRNLTEKQCIDQFERIFESACLGEVPSGDAVHPFCCHPKGYRMSAWCSSKNGRIYDDYLQDFRPDIFAGMFDREDSVYSKDELLRMGISEVQLDESIRRGILIYE